MEEGITCPDSHPIHYPRVFFELSKTPRGELLLLSLRRVLVWETAPFKDMWSEAFNTSQPFVYVCNYDCAKPTIDQYLCTGYWRRDWIQLARGLCQRSHLCITTSANLIY